MASRSYKSNVACRSVLSFFFVSAFLSILIYLLPSTFSSVHANEFPTARMEEEKNSNNGGGGEEEEEVDEEKKKEVMRLVKEGLDEVEFYRLISLLETLGESDKYYAIKSLVKQLQKKDVLFVEDLVNCMDKVPKSVIPYILWYAMEELTAEQIILALEVLPTAVYMDMPKEIYDKLDIMYLCEKLSFKRIACLPSKILRKLPEDFIQKLPEETKKRMQGNEDGPKEISGNVATNLSLAKNLLFNFFF